MELMGIEPTASRVRLGDAESNIKRLDSNFVTGRDGLDAFSMTCGCDENDSCWLPERESGAP
jgi:hypothetical protein